MELSYDWRSFQSVFFPGKRVPLNLLEGGGAEQRTPIYVVTENDAIVCAFSEYDDLSSWIGQSYRELATEMPHRELVLFNRDKVDQALQSSLGLPHYYDQIEFLRAEGGALRMAEATKKAGVPAKKLKLKTPKPFRLKPGTREVAPRHFLLEALQGGWGKVLPSAYGIHLRITSEAADRNSKVPATLTNELFLIFRRGRLDSFQVPDLGIFGRENRERLNDTAAVARYLSETHLVPVQALVVTSQDWAEWTASPNPWKLIASAIRRDRARLFPFRWGVALLVAARAFFGI
jgi:hypothetical protein